MQGSGWGVEENGRDGWGPQQLKGPREDFPLSGNQTSNYFNKIYIQAGGIQETFSEKRQCMSTGRNYPNFLFEVLQAWQGAWW